MNPTPNEEPGDEDSGPEYQPVGTVSAAKKWLAGLARVAVAALTFPEPIPSLTSGLVVINATLERADGSRAYFRISCRDDRVRTNGTDLLSTASSSVTAESGWR